MIVTVLVGWKAGLSWAVAAERTRALATRVETSTRRRRMTTLPAGEIRIWPTAQGPSICAVRGAEALPHPEQALRACSGARCARDGRSAPLAEEHHQELEQVHEVEVEAERTEDCDLLGNV